MNIGRSFESAQSPGKYDAECEAAFRSCEAQGCLLLIIGGKKGHGFSAVLSSEIVDGVPTMLRNMANEIESQRKEAIKS